MELLKTTVTCHVKSHGVTCQPTQVSTLHKQVNAPHRVHLFILMILLLSTKAGVLDQMLNKACHLSFTQKEVLLSVILFIYKSINIFEDILSAITIFIYLSSKMCSFFCKLLPL